MQFTTASAKCSRGNGFALGSIRSTPNRAVHPVERQQSPAGVDYCNIDFDIQLAKAAGMQPTDPKVLASYVSDPVSARNYGGGEGQLSGNYIATNYPIDHSSVVTPPYNFGRTYTEDPLANLINVSPTYPNTPPPGTIVNNNPFLGGGSALGSDPIQLSDVSQYYKSADAPPPPKEYFDEVDQ